MPNPLLFMTDAERTEIRQKIESEIVKMTQQIAELQNLTKPVSPDNAIGRISRMDAINNRSVSLAGLHAAKARLSRLEYAISRINQPEFGFCTRCKEAIPVGRLLFMPESTRCVKCVGR